MVKWTNTKSCYSNINRYQKNCTAAQKALDEDIDKTGYNKLKTEALCKAFKYCANISEVTIGPEACPSETIISEKTDNLDSSYSKTFAQRRLLLIKGNNELLSNHVEVIPQKEKEEERYCAKKLIAELNKFCVIDSQRMKFAKLKKRLENIEGAKRDTESLLAKEDAIAILRMKELQEQIDLIQSQLLAKQQLLDSSTFISRDTTNKRIEEIKKQEEEQKLREKINEGKKLYDLIYTNQVEFRNAYSEILNVITNLKENKHVIHTDIELASKLQAKFIALIARCKKGEITQTDVALSSSLLRDILSVSTKLKIEKAEIEAKRIRDEIKAKKIKDEIEAKRIRDELEAKEKSLERLEDVTDAKDEDLDNSVPSCKTTGEKQTTEYNYLKNYEMVDKFLAETEKKLEVFLTDESLKKYRSDCLKAVNLPVNAISPVNANHLTDKLKKLSTLLQGHSVTVADKRVSASTHPLGISYCMNLLAEKIVRQGEQVISRKPDAAFAIAAVTVALWVEFPDFGKLLLAHFYRKCPYLIPFYWDREESETEEEYYKKLGFAYSNGTREDVDMFLKRQGGIVKLYSSIIVSDIKKSVQPQIHPLGLGACWRLLVAFVKLEPKSEISATVLYDILDITGYAMVRAYGIQFHKLLHVICKSYLPKIVEVTPDGKCGGPLTRLRNFLESIAKGKTLQPPQGLLPPNFW